MYQYSLAIDGGGTKTDVVLLNADNGVIHRVIGESTNPNSLKFNQVEQHFETIFAELFQNEMPSNIIHCFAGISGADHPDISRQLEVCIRNVCPVPIINLEVGNDAKNALWSGTDGDHGLVVIAGTGSIAYGEKENGETFRIGGWGYLFGDEGSGYDIGKEAIRNVLMSYDGRNPQTILTSFVKKYFEIDSIQDLIPIIYQSPKHMIAGLVPLVEKSALEGDKIAMKIMINAVESLVSLIQAALKQYSSNPKIVLTGGIWNSVIIRKEIRKLIPQDLVFLNYPPVYGSIIRTLSKLEGSKKGNLLEKVKDQLKIESPCTK
ncbi:N-acetylglucosamine kinase [Terrilactibacillus laevilacticus]|uniref:N-acetylglucosamine kinase n=1 Tax=Terrilactibacillus laevilacticus TaxID=1380157 RepID=UPI001FE29C69|nr:BadF/BadG/BcrA/BcrD ATPase family protein [Terrilactibacillus laevilacticus]